jgi:hypothetical protein
MTRLAASLRFLIYGSVKQQLVYRHSVTCLFNRVDAVSKCWPLQTCLWYLLAFHLNSYYKSMEHLEGIFSLNFKFLRNFVHYLPMVEEQHSLSRPEFDTPSHHMRFMVVSLKWISSEYLCFPADHNGREAQGVKCLYFIRTLGSWVRIPLEVCLCALCICVVCVGSDLPTGWSPSKRTYRLKKRPGSNKDL